MSIPFRYPWDTWFKKPRFRLKRGREFNAQIHSMLITVRNNATKRGLKVNLSVEKEDTIVVTVLSGRER